MGKIETFRKEHSFEDRHEESKSIIAKYPDRIPVIIEKYARTDLPDLEKKKYVVPLTIFVDIMMPRAIKINTDIKYLVPLDMSFGQFIHILSSRLQLSPGKALFVFVKNTLPQTASQMDSIYESYKDADGFLYMCYSTEKTFG